jgi:hypothetical protein
MHAYYQGFHSQLQSTMSVRGYQDRAEDALQTLNVVTAQVQDNACLVLFGDQLHVGIEMNQHPCLCTMNKKRLCLQRIAPLGSFRSVLQTVARITKAAGIV